MPKLHPPEARLGFMDLPGTRLHYVTCGTGPPLIIIPATVSLIRQWQPLAQFLGLGFTTYFFELPGHGLSTPYPSPFNSRLVPATVEAFADRLGFSTFNLMGFSFGGLLALRTLEQLHGRIDKMILFSPLVSYRALRYSQRKQWVLKNAVHFFKKPRVQRTAVQIMRAQSLHRPLIHALSRFSQIDKAILESKDALNIPLSTLDVLAHTVDEILSMEYRPPQPFSTPCYFGMSVNDDLIEYNLTEQLVSENFTQLKKVKFHHPYHQPPVPPTFEWLVQEFHPFIEMIL